MPTNIRGAFILVVYTYRHRGIFVVIGQVSFSLLTFIALPGLLNSSQRVIDFFLH